MIAGRDFVVLSDDWRGLPTSAGHLFRVLSKSNRVFWLNVVGRLPRLSARDARKVWHTLRGWMGWQQGDSGPSGIQGSAGVRVSTPLVIPHFKTWIRRFNLASMGRTYERLRAEYRIHQPILVTTFPFSVDFFQKVQGAVKVYYCVDDFLEYPGINHRDWSQMEAQLVNSVDGIVVTSRTLAEKNTAGLPLLHLPHGVDFEHFHGARMNMVEEPRMSGIPGPIVGYFGLMTSWFDVELMQALSERFPACSFVVIGRADVDIGALLRRPNVYYLGPIAYADLPRYARYFRVGLCPYVSNRWIRASNPLKLLEYFAMGLPVVATRLPELEQMRGPLHLATTLDEFCAGLEVALGSGPGTSEEAIEIARENTWSARVEHLGRFVNELASLRASIRPGVV